jgi:hypothetical protein
MSKPPLSQNHLVFSVGRIPIWLDSNHLGSSVVEVVCKERSPKLRPQVESNEVETCR